MKQYIDKAAIVAEIRKRLLPTIRDKHYDEWEEGQDSERIAILEIIDTLEVKEVQNIPVPDNETALFGANGYRNNVWHDRRETPEYKEDKNNQILVYGQNSAGRGCSVCSMIADGVIYSPMTHKEYKWGKCHFTQWAYIEDLLPTEGYKE